MESLRDSVTIMNIKKEKPHFISIKFIVLYCINISFKHTFLKLTIYVAALSVFILI